LCPNNPTRNISVRSFDPWLSWRRQEFHQRSARDGRTEEQLLVGFAERAGTFTPEDPQAKRVNPQ
jgi:hypothetical protein